MRHQQNRRSRSRSRKGPNPLTRSFESNGPDVKVRGTAAHIAEKYVTLARDAQSSGDIVAAENYLQHAEHYTRIVMAAQAQFQPVQQPQFRDDDGYDDERAMNGRGPHDRFEFNGEAARGDDDGDGFEGDDEDDARAFQVPEPARGPRPDDRDRGPGPRPDRFDRRDDRGDRSERGFRGDRNNDRNGRGDRPQRDARGDRPEREARGDRPERDDRGERGYRHDRDYRGERSDRPDRTNGLDPAERDYRGERPAREDRGERTARNDRGEAPGPSEAFDERVAPTVMAGGPESVSVPAEMSDEAPAKPARRRRTPRAQTTADEQGDAAQPDATPDGAAALVAFPD